MDYIGSIPDPRRWRGVKIFEQAVQIIVTLAVMATAPDKVADREVAGAGAKFMARVPVRSVNRS